MRPLPNVAARSSASSGEPGAAFSAPTAAAARGSALLMDRPLGGCDGCRERGCAGRGVGYAAADGRPTRLSAAPDAAHAVGSTDHCPRGCAPGDDDGGLCPVAHRSAYPGTGPHADLYESALVLRQARGPRPAAQPGPGALAGECAAASVDLSTVSARRCAPVSPAVLALSLDGQLPGPWRAVGRAPGPSLGAGIGADDGRPSGLAVPGWAHVASDHGRYCSPAQRTAPAWRKLGADGPSGDR